MIWSIFDSWANKQKIKEATNFLVRLESLSDQEVGAYVALCIDQAHLIWVEKQIDLYQPKDCNKSDPYLLMSLSRAASECQANGNFGAASRLMLWVHTLRSAESPELYFLGRHIWAQLSRGFPYAEAAAFDYFQETGKFLYLTRLGEFPDGLGPSTEE